MIVKRLSITLFAASNKRNRNFERIEILLAGEQINEKTDHITSLWSLSG